MNEQHRELTNKILDLRETLLKTHPDIRCFVISALGNNSDRPVVVYHGNQLEYTALSVETARVLYQRIADKTNE